MSTKGEQTSEAATEQRSKRAVLAILSTDGFPGACKTPPARGQLTIVDFNGAARLCWDYQAQMRDYDEGLWMGLSEEPAEDGTGSPVVLMKAMKEYAAVGPVLVTIPIRKFLAMLRDNRHPFAGTAVMGRERGSVWVSHELTQLLCSTGSPERHAKAFVAMVIENLCDSQSVREDGTVVWSHVFPAEQLDRIGYGDLPVHDDRSGRIEDNQEAGAEALSDDEYLPF